MFSDDEFGLWSMKAALLFLPWKILDLIKGSVIELIALLVS